MQPGLQAIAERMKAAPPVKWLFTGDSITHGALHTWGFRDYTEHFSERIRYEMDRRRDMVIKTGISGWTTKLIRDDIDWNILQFNADVVSIMIGMNDSTQGPAGIPSFRDNYEFILDRVLAGKRAHVILHTTNPIWAEATNRAGLPEYNEEIRHIARRRQLPLIEHWEYWTKAFIETPLRRTTWMNDAIHPGAQGHLAFAYLLFKELGIYDPASHICRLFLL
jgi:acyl-CoA thioesterase I